MSAMIALTGKGGVGKTTIAGLIVRRLVRSGRVPVLAIDADPNCCLDAALGVQAEKTVGRAREETRDEVSKRIAGIPKQVLLRSKIAESVVEAHGFDLIAMGRPEGPGCYCYANNVLRSVLTEMASQYPYVVLDNEAGLENLSRRIVQKVNTLIMVSDPSNSGLNTVLRLHSLTLEMGIHYNRLLLVLNRIRGAAPARITEIQALTSAEAILVLPDDMEVSSLAEQGGGVLDLPESNPVVSAVNAMTDHFCNGK